MLMQHRRRKDEVTIAVTPLIDVILVLLIFFMVSAKFNRDTQMQVNLPEASGDSAAPVARIIVEISIDARGNLFVGDSISKSVRPLANNELATIKAALHSIADGDSEVPLVISADAQAPYQAVATAMDAAGQMGFHKLTMQAQAESDG